MIIQGSQKIEVIVRKEGGGGEKNNRETSADNIGGKNDNQLPAGGFFGRNPMRTIKVNATHLVAVSKQFLNAQINYQMQKIGYISGDEAYQDRVGRQVEIVQDAGNVATSVAMGAVYGAAGGPFGILAGMAIGAASSGISLAYKYKGRYLDYDFKMFKENNAIEYKRARANINLTTGRLR